MNIKSAKAKGRRLCEDAKEIILRAFPSITADDVRVNPASCPGEDLWLSPAARAVLPLCFEMKNHEKAKPWDWIAQARSYARDGRCPVVVFSRNREPEPYAIVSLKDLIFLISGKEEKQNGIHSKEKN